MNSSTITLGEAAITLEWGQIARQANGAVLLRQNDTVILVTAVAASHETHGQDFFPLTVEYRERTAAAGRIPGSYIKREARSADHEIIGARIIDRTIRPLFPKGYKNEVQVIATVLSADPEGDPETLSILGASAALTLSDIPWNGPVVGVRVISIGGKFIVNPSRSMRRDADLDLVVSVGPEGMVMVEGEAGEVPEEAVIEALLFAQEAAQEAMQTQQQLQAEQGQPKATFTPPSIDQDLVALVREKAAGLLPSVMTIAAKKQRRDGVHTLEKSLLTEICSEKPELAPIVKTIFEEFHSQLVRSLIIDESRRIDGRDLATVRPISIVTSWLPRVHGSALFTRGETQAMVSCTLGVGDDEQRVETLFGEERERFMLHYNFPPYATGEVKALRGPGRREIGHGNLARRALAAILPEPEAFPYTIRIVSDISESNGSSSMASVCGGCLALMDAGVPIKRPVAGVAMGLIKENDRIAVLTDILGDEDHLGDMDFKVTGTAEGVTALQMDIKIGGLSRDILERALAQARAARLHILNVMGEHLPRPRASLSPYAPRVIFHRIRPDRIRDVIGPGGKIIQEIQAVTGAKIEIEDSGEVRIYAPDQKSTEWALKRVRYFTDDLEVGKVYRGIVTDVKDFGAFVRISGSAEGLVHISELDEQRIKAVTDVANSGDEMLVRVLGVENNGRIKLSRKAALHARSDEIVEW